MRSISAIVLSAGVLALALSGCGGFSPQPTKKTPTQTQTPAPSAVSEPTVPAIYGTVTLPQGENYNGGFFNASSPWNQTVDWDPIDVNSAQLIHDALMRVGVLDQSGNRPPIIERRFINAGLYINTTAWTDPVVWGGPETRIECRQIHCGNVSGITELPIPANVNPDPRYDGWFTVIYGNTAYDLWRARRLANGSISFQYGRAWNLNGLGYLSPGQTSARGSGLPLFAGLIRPQELEAGQINHALAISVPAPASGNYVQPASSTDGNGTTNSLPEGARLRLKAGVTFQNPVNPQTGNPIPLTPQQQRYASAILYALRHYGAIVVGRAAVPTLYAQRDVTSNLLMGNELQGITLEDFNVLALPPRIQDTEGPANG